MKKVSFIRRFSFIGQWLSAVVCITWAIQVGLLGAEQAERGLDIYWIDVEGGAATLLVTPAGETVLIDTGNPGLRDPQRIVKTVLEQAGRQRIDYLIVTHYHRDHYGGAATLARLLPIGTLYDNGRFDGMPDDPGREYFEFPCQQRIVMQPGMQIPLKQRDGTPSVRMTCLAARQQIIAPSPGSPSNEAICAMHQDKPRDESDNANSIVMLVEFGGFRFFDAGDLTWNLEHKLVCPVNSVGEVDVYQVTHHGLDSSNNPVVLRSIRPTVAIMNNGATKGCMPEVFANLKETDSIQAIYQVHKNLRPDGSVNNVSDEFIANHQEACKGEGIVLSVVPDASRYEVRVAATGHRQTYPVKRKP
jgi:beta-lactamase superfamily II metal-dependent hydrolase